VVLRPLLCAAIRERVDETWQEQTASVSVQADGYLSSTRCLVRGRAQAKSLESEHSI
jgi:hypothetical protein